VQARRAGLLSIAYRADGRDVGVSCRDIKAKEAPTTAALALFGHTFSRLMQEYVSRKDCSLSTRAIMNFLRMVQALASSVDARVGCTLMHFTGTVPVALLWEGEPLLCSVSALASRREMASFRVPHRGLASPD
jgi:hypothetical protein